MPRLDLGHGQHHRKIRERGGNGEKERRDQVYAEDHETGASQRIGVQWSAPVLGTLLVNDSLEVSPRRIKIVGDFVGTFSQTAPSSPITRLRKYLTLQDS